MMDPFAAEMDAARRREEVVRWAELMRLAAEGRPRREPRARLRHRLAHALIALAHWIDDVPHRAPRLAST